ncbi:MAG TPA: hypothetical protein VJI33_00770 [Candidatus Paceibacterota bacterium]
MKTACAVFCSLLMVIVASSRAVGADGKTNSYVNHIQTPLPEPFEGLLKANLVSGLFPAAIYTYSNGLVTFACVGTAFQSGASSFSVIVCEHIFPKGEDLCYCIRIANKSSNNVVGFISKIELSSKDLKGCDAVVATIERGEKKIKGFSLLDAENNYAKITFTNSVVISKMSVTNLRSLITGKPVKILGYGRRAGREERPLIAAESKNTKGYSGSGYVDEHGRLFVLHGGMPQNGTILLDGPLVLDKN